MEETPAGGSEKIFWMNNNPYQVERAIAIAGALSELRRAGWLVSVDGDRIKIRRVRRRSRRRQVVQRSVWRQ